MDTFDTCDSCGIYYVTQDRDVLTSREQGYIPEEWNSIEAALQTAPKWAAIVAMFGNCYVCGSTTGLHYRFTV